MPTLFHTCLFTAHLFHPLFVRNDVKFAWKVQRDVAERGWTEEQVRKGSTLEDVDLLLVGFVESR